MKEYLEEHPDCENEDIHFLHCDCWFLKEESAETEWERDLCCRKLVETSLQGLEKCPDSLLIKKNLGIGYIKSGQLEQGEKIFSELIDAMPDSALFHYDMACTLAIKGDVTKVLKHLGKAIEIEENMQMLARVDPDFDTIWRNPDFQNLIF